MHRSLYRYYNIIDRDDHDHHDDHFHKGFLLIFQKINEKNCRKCFLSRCLINWAPLLYAPDTGH